MKRLLLHTCCGPCFLGVWEEIKDSGLAVTNYFYNPNVQPKEEYARRLENFKKAIKGRTKDSIEESYQPKEHFDAIRGQENDFPERCLKCYRLRLEKTAARAGQEGFNFFSTTLLVSPYQNHEALLQIGEEIGAKYGVGFYYRDWRPYFRRGQQAAREIEIYRQKYCGCIYSLEEGSKQKPKRD